MATPPTLTDREPPTAHSTPMKVAASSTALSTPVVKSTGASVAPRTSSAMRYSGFLWSPLMRLS